MIQANSASIIPKTVKAFSKEGRDDIGVEGMAVSEVQHWKEGGGPPIAIASLSQYILHSALQVYTPPLLLPTHSTHPPLHCTSNSATT